MLLILFILLLISAITLYMIGKKEISVIIFFFFLFDSFQLIPEKMIGIKTLDLAIIYVCILFIWGIIRYDDYIPRNTTTLFISLFLLFVFFEMLLSRYSYGISWIEIIRTGRQNLLLLSYFVFRRISRAKMEYILKILFIVVIIESFLFATQTFTGIGIMNDSHVFLKVGSIYRFYNISLMHYFFVFYAVFNNPFKNVWKQATMLIALITIFLPMHRSLAMAVILILIFGFMWKKNVFNSFKRMIIAGCCCFFLFAIASAYISARTIEDINKVASGDFQEIEDVKVSSESTFLFRITHFYERYTAVIENNLGKWFGVGFMTEGSTYTENNFNFIIGLENEEGGIDQVNTPDISWSIFIIRYGIFGTLIFLLFYSYFIVYYIRQRNKNPICMIMVLYLLLIFSNSLTSDLLYKINMLIFPLIYIDQCNEKLNTPPSPINIHK